MNDRASESIRIVAVFPLQDSHLLAEGEYLCVERRAAQKGLADDGEEDFDRLMHAGENIRRWAEIPKFPRRMELMGGTACQISFPLAKPGASIHDYAPRR
jgi:hypothetical protein